MINARANHESFMAQALLEAEKAAQAGEVPVGAVAVKDGQVIARAHNVRETTCDPCGHAEILAIKKAAQTLGTWKLADVTLYVTLEPCPMCAGAIGQCRVDQVVFGAYDPAMGCAGSVYELCGDRRVQANTKILGGILKESCEKLLSDFFRSRRTQTEK